MGKRVRYRLNDVIQNNFYQMPKFLFSGELKKLSNDARVLYSLLKDRHNLSIENQWINDNNEVYIIFTRNEMCEMLGLSENTVTKIVKQLKKYELIEEVSQGLNRPNIIYLTALDYENKPATVDNTGPAEFTVPEPQNLRFRNRKNYDSGTVKITAQDPQNLRGIILILIILILIILILIILINLSINTNPMILKQYFL